ncbi:glycosyltransferase family 9 protein, partial [Staphylococcus aureus]
LSQPNFILANSSLHICNDTFSAHVAGAENVPLLSLYTVSPPEVCGPEWKNELKTILLQSPRKGNKPSYASNEFPKTINEIGIASVLNAINDLLELNLKNVPEATDEGDEFARGLSNPVTNFILELIPNDVFAPQFPSPHPFPIRDDLFQSDENIVAQMNITTSLIISNRKIEPRILAHPNMHGYM